jgi:hypothetical protein
MCEKMLFIKANGVQTKEHGGTLCVTTSHSWSSWNNFHEQSFGLFTKIVFPFIFTVEFVSNFKNN